MKRTARENSPSTPESTPAATNTDIPAEATEAAVSTASRSRTLAYRQMREYIPRPKNTAGLSSSATMR